MAPVLPLLAAAGIGAVVSAVLGEDLDDLPERIGASGRRGGVQPHFGRLEIEEAELLLAGLLLIDQRQLLEGVPPISQALKDGTLKYIRRDPHEHFRTIRELWHYGGGDCEDLSTAVAAEIAVQTGQLARLVSPARPVFYQARPGLWHSVTEVAGGRRIDPSRTGGMGRE